MSLRRQVLLLALLSLLLPWAGYAYLGELAQTLRAGQLQALLARAEVAARLLARDFPAAGASLPDERDIYAQRLPAPLALDGYDDDWSTVPGAARRFHFGDHKRGPVAASGQVAEVALRAAEDGQRLYLFLRVRDDHQRYERPLPPPADDERRRFRGEPPGRLGDHLLLRLSLHGGPRRDYLLATPAPGRLQARYRGPRRAGRRALLVEPRIRGSWQDTGEGYSLELSLPLPPAAAEFAFAVLDADAEGDDPRQRWSGTADPLRPAASGGRLRRGEPALAAALAQLGGDDLSLAAYDSGGWRLAAVRPSRRAAAGAGEPAEAPDDSAGGAFDDAFGGALDELLERAAARLFAALLEDRGRLPALPDSADGRLDGALFAAARNGAPLPPDYYRAGRRTHLAVALPVRGGDGAVRGVLLASQPSRAVDALAGRALLRLLSLGLLAVVLITAALLGYASWLSWRVRRLRDAAARGVDVRGVPVARRASGSARESLPGSAAGDELGELARDFGTLLARQRDYTDYLRGMNARLAHELRTPLAVVSGALENLDDGELSAAARRYRERALAGSARLQRLLDGLAEATRIEQVLALAEPEELDLGAFLRAATAAYADAWPGRDIRCAVAAGTAPKVRADAALLAQLLDKLVANALDFCTPGGAVELRLELAGEAGQGGCALAVHNPGPALPAAVRERPGEPLGSHRGAAGRDPPDAAADAGAAHLGLGLYIARLIAEAHGARLQLLDEGDGVTARVLFAARAGSEPAALR